MTDEELDAVCSRAEVGIFDANDIRAILQGMVDEIGTQAAFCRRHGVDRPSLSNILAGKEAPYGKFLDILGIRAVTLYIHKTDKRFCSTPTKKRDDVKERWRVKRSIEATARNQKAKMLEA